MNTTAILRSVAGGERSAREVCDEALAHIESTNGTINAFTEVTAARARAEAAAVDARRARGEICLRWPGLPYAVKNLFDIEGITTLSGSKINRDLPAAREDAVLVQQLQSAGAILVGALNMDEYAYGFTTRTPLWADPQPA